jgi:hypothetical protein
MTYSDTQANHEANPASKPVPLRAPAPTNTLAIISLVTSLLGIGLAGVICGHMALSEIRKSSESGHGLAIAGLIIGYVQIVGVAILSALTLLFPIFLFALFGGPK